MKQEPTEATMRNCHGNAVGILVTYGEEDVNSPTAGMIARRLTRVPGSCFLLPRFFYSLFFPVALRVLVSFGQLTPRRMAALQAHSCLSSRRIAALVSARSSPVWSGQSPTTYYFAWPTCLFEVSCL
jgi:hypothetical protein